MTPKSPQEFPKMLYHRTKSPVVVKSKEEQNALGGEWQEKPVPPEEASAPPAKLPHQKEK